MKESEEQAIDNFLHMLAAGEVQIVDGSNHDDKIPQWPEIEETSHFFMELCAERLTWWTKLGSYAYMCYVFFGSPDLSSSYIEASEENRNKERERAKQSFNNRARYEFYRMKKSFIDIPGFDLSLSDISKMKYLLKSIKGIDIRDIDFFFKYFDEHEKDRPKQLRDHRWVF